jgi:hypothetical protein
MKMKKVIYLSLMGFMVLFCGCQADTQGWATENINNGLIALQIVPEIGGRVMQYSLGEHDFFWNNPKLINVAPPESGLGLEGQWLDYGGEKLWPAPQGWDNDQQWPGPPDAVLDGGPYAMKTLTENKAVKLTSQKDMASGIQFSRVIKIADGTTRISIDATMTNIDTKPRRWGIWSVLRMDASSRIGDEYNKNFRAYCTLNPDSKFYKGYDIQFGLVNNPTFVADHESGMFKVHYQRLVGKARIDSPGGWVAVANGEDGYVFVQRYTYEPGKAYPDDASVEFWTHGTGAFYAWSKLNTMAESPKETPNFFECELLSPYAALNPGEQYSFHYDWYSAKIPSGLGIVDCTETGVVCEPLAAVRNGKSLNITGKFGVFYEGSLVVHYLDAAGNNIHTESMIQQVSPLKASVLSHTLRAIENTASVSLHLYDKTGRDVGQLARASL